MPYEILKEVAAPVAIVIVFSYILVVILRDHRQTLERMTAKHEETIQYITNKHEETVRQLVSESVASHEGKTKAFLEEQSKSKESFDKLSAAYMASDERKLQMVLSYKHKEQPRHG